MDVREETTDESEMQQWHKRTKYKTAVTSRKQENCHQDFQADHKAGDCKANSRFFCKTGENNVEGPAPSQTKEETTNSLSAAAAGVVATLESFAHTDQ
jgi:hypothetical protein